MPAALHILMLVEMINTVLNTKFKILNVWSKNMNSPTLKVHSSHENLCLTMMYCRITWTWRIYFLRLSFCFSSLSNFTYRPKLKNPKPCIIKHAHITQVESLCQWSILTSAWNLFPLCPTLVLVPSTFLGLWRYEFSASNFKGCCCTWTQRHG